MLRFMLKTKIHRATVTESDVAYEGSLTVDRDLMDAADMVSYERVEVYDVDNGSRFATYLIEGERGSGVFTSPTAVEQDVLDKYGVEAIGRTQEITERFYAISAERRIKHPAVTAITADRKRSCSRSRASSRSR